MRKVHFSMKGSRNVLRFCMAEAAGSEKQRRQELTPWQCEQGLCESNDSVIFEVVSICVIMRYVD